LVLFSTEASYVGECVAQGVGRAELLRVWFQRLDAAYREHQQAVEQFQRILDGRADNYDSVLTQEEGVPQLRVMSSC
jgi:hypothetical protein